MRIIVVQTPSVEGFSQEKVYPIGIVALATHLEKAGHEVELLDYRPEVVGLSLRKPVYLFP
jgi:anaerobic magnesium-protoporphyrin IX monomethyl ester cyclase